MNKLNCILLVDDDPATNFVNEITIQKAGAADSIVKAKNGLEALDYIQSVADAPQDAPALILLDINMPAMNGWEFLEEYSKLKDITPAPVIVMLTTSLNPDDKLKADKITQIKGFENKPLTKEALEKIYEKFFPK